MPLPATCTGVSQSPGRPLVDNRSRRCRNSRAFKVATGFSQRRRQVKQIPSALAGRRRAPQIAPPAAIASTTRACRDRRPATVKLDGVALRFQNDMSCCALVIVGRRDHLIQLCPSHRRRACSTNRSRSRCHGSRATAPRRCAARGFPTTSLNLRFGFRGRKIECGGHVCGVRFKWECSGECPGMCVDLEKRLDDYSYVRRETQWLL